jgi:Tfp pilus assembly protein PilF
MIKKLFKLIACILLISNPLVAQNKNFQKGVVLFQEKKFQDAKFKFEQEIVINPKSELSYLYLSEIFKNLDKKKLQENNLNTVILLNPNNEEATFNLAKLKLENSDYKKSKELNDKLSLFCKKLCAESKKLKNKIENLSKK